MYKKLFRFIPIFSLLVLWFVFSSPYFLHNLVPYPSRYQVSFFAPWSTYPQYWGPVKNNAMPDVIDQIYPWKHFTIDSLKAGNIPYWNPNNFAGNPNVANFQTAVFSPFNILYFLLPFVDSWSVIVLLQPLLAGVFTYFFLRELKISSAGAVLGGITFMFSGFMVVWMAYGTLSMAAAFLPLALWGIERGFHKNKWYFFVMTIAVVISFFSGHFQTSFYFAVYVAAYLLFKSTSLLRKYYSSPSAFAQGKHTFSTVRNIIMWVTVFYFLSFVLSLPQLYPTIVFYQNSVRSGLVYMGGGIPVDYIITALAPDFFGNPVTRNDWRGNYAEWASFIGVIPFFFALMAFRRSKDLYRYFFIAAGLLCLLFAMETPLHNLLIATRLPIVATSIPSRLIVFFSFSIAVLAGIGFTDFQLLKKKELIKNLLPPVIVLSIIFVVAGVSISIFHVFPQDKNNLALKNLILPLGIFVLSSGLLFCLRFISNKKIVTTASLFILLLAGLDGYRFAMKWMPFEPKELVFPDVPVVSVMQKHIGYGRIYGNLGTQAESYYNLPSLEGYDPLYVQRYGEFIRYAQFGSFQQAERSVVHLDRRGKYTDRVLDFLGVNLIFHPLGDTGQEWAYPVWKDIKKYSVIYQDDKFQLYRNNTVMPRASLFYQVETIPDGEKLLKRFYSDSFDFRKIILLEKEVLSKQSAAATGSAKIVSYMPNVVKITVASNNTGILFLSDTYYPGWEATVNGKREEVLRADYAFRAVRIPAGKSIVIFRYKQY